MDPPLAGKSSALPVARKEGNTPSPQTYPFSVAKGNPETENHSPSKYKPLDRTWLGNLRVEVISASICRIDLVKSGKTAHPKLRVRIRLVNTNQYASELYRPVIESDKAVLKDDSGKEIPMLRALDGKQPVGSSADSRRRSGYTLSSLATDPGNSNIRVSSSHLPGNTFSMVRGGQAASFLFDFPEKRAFWNQNSKSLIRFNLEPESRTRVSD